MANMALPTPSPSRRIPLRLAGQGPVIHFPPFIAPKPKLLDRVRQAIRARHLSHHTESAYIGWIKRFIFFYHKRHPAKMGEIEIAPYPCFHRDRLDAGREGRQEARW